MNESQMRALYSAARAAGLAAGEAAVPRPMVVYESGLDDKPRPGGQSWYVPEGLCGFAWVNIKPGNSRFANWLKRKGLARSDSYYGGVSVWVSDFNQSHARKVAYADAFARVLNDAGIRAYANDRLD